MKALLLLLSLLTGAAVAATAERPNLVLIIADDLGAADSGPYGAKGVRTPHLDRLAREGLRFTQAFNTCSSCSPSRASIITGRYPHSTGAEMLHQPLPREQITFVEKLKAAGYWTAAAGKWHLGPQIMDRFDVVKAAPGSRPTATDDGSACAGWVPLLRERPKDKPFFLWLASVDPHRPYFPDTLPEPHRAGDASVPPYLPDAAVTREDFAAYYDEIGRLDSYVGKVLAELAQQGVLEQTAVVFITDNGRPFPRCKGTVYDSGIQSPMLVRWPGRVPAGRTCGSLVSMVDLAPTLLALAGLPALPSFQGRSFASLLLQDPSAPFRDRVFAEHNWHDYAACERAVRTERHKYIRNYWPDLPGTPVENDNPTIIEMRRRRDLGTLTAAQMNGFIKPRPAEELYDLLADPDELNNLAADPRQAEVLGRLRQMLDEWRHDTADFIRSPRPADTFDRETGKRIPAAGKKAAAKSPAQR
jgi:N-sulfoglucosamine sulfohydrolase